jgi:hypothetical protein
MKNLILILITAFSLVLTATSCKKEKQAEPAPAPATQTPVTMVPVTLTVAFIEDLSSSQTITSPSVVFLDVNGNVDTTYTVIPITTVPGPLLAGPCSVIGTTPITYSTSIPDGSEFRMQIYSGTTKIVDYRISQSGYANDYVSLGTCSACSSELSLVACY